MRNSMNIRNFAAMTLMAGLLGGYGSVAPPMPAMPYSGRRGRHTNNLMRTVGSWGPSPEPKDWHNTRTRTKKGVQRPTWRDGHAKATNKIEREWKALKGRSNGADEKALRLQRSEARRKVKETA